MMGGSRAQITSDVAFHVLSIALSFLGVGSASEKYRSLQIILVQYLINVYIDMQKVEYNHGTIFNSIYTSPLDETVMPPGLVDLGPRVFVFTSSPMPITHRGGAGERGKYPSKVEEFRAWDLFDPTSASSRASLLLDHTASVTQFIKAEASWGRT